MITGGNEVGISGCVGSNNILSHFANRALSSSQSSCFFPKRSNPPQGSIHPWSQTGYAVLPIRHLFQPYDWQVAFRYAPWSQHTIFDPVVVARNHTLLIVGSAYPINILNVSVTFVRHKWQRRFLHLEAQFKQNVWWQGSQQWVGGLARQTLQIGEEMPNNFLTRCMCCWIVLVCSSKELISLPDLANNLLYFSESVFNSATESSTECSIVLKTNF